MKFSLQTEYAIELMERLSRSVKTATLTELLDGTSIGKTYAEVVIQKLREAGLVRSVRGRKGGYQLGRAKVTLWDIINAVEGSIKPERQVVPSVQRGYDVLAQGVAKSLGGVSLQALAQA